MDHRFQTSDGVMLSRRDVGRGDPVVFVHALGLNGSMWDAVVERLRPHRRCLVPDVRGHGTSDRGEGEPTITRLADDLAELLDDADVQSCALVGVSMGGIITLEFMRRFSHRVSALVLCGTRISADTPEAARARLELAQRTRREGSRVVAEALAGNLFAPDVDDDLAEHWLGVISSCDPAGLAGAIAALAHRPDAAPVLETIDVPALVVAGEHDRITPPELARDTHLAIAGSRLAIIPDAGHLPPIEQPHHFTDTLSAFLTRPPRA